MIAWEDLPKVEQLAGEYYDFYKDVHGIRPRWIFNSEGNCVYTEQEMEAMLERLAKEAEVVWAEEKAREEEAVKKFEQHVTNTICMGAKDRATALRWIMEASKADGDWSYFCYLEGLPYNYFKEEALTSSSV